VVDGAAGRVAAGRVAVEEGAFGKVAVGRVAGAEGGREEGPQGIKAHDANYLGIYIVARMSGLEGVKRSMLDLDEALPGSLAIPFVLGFATKVAMDHELLGSGSIGLGCHLQKAIYGSYLMRETITFGIILATFLVAARVRGAANPVNPGYTISHAFIFYALLTIWNKMALVPTILVAVAFFTLFLLGSYKDYYKALYAKERHHSEEGREQQQARMSRIDTLRALAMTVALVTLAIGFPMYLLQQRRAHRKNWDIRKFLFGRRKCDGVRKVLLRGARRGWYTYDIANR